MMSVEEASMRAARCDEPAARTWACRYTPLQRPNTQAPCRCDPAERSSPSHHARLCPDRRFHSPSTRRPPQHQQAILSMMKLSRQNAMLKPMAPSRLSIRPSRVQPSSRPWPPSSGKQSTSSTDRRRCRYTIHTEPTERIVEVRRRLGLFLGSDPRHPRCAVAATPSVHRAESSWSDDHGPRAQRMPDSTCASIAARSRLRPSRTRRRIAVDRWMVLGSPGLPALKHLTGPKTHAAATEMTVQNHILVGLTAAIGHA